MLRKVRPDDVATMAPVRADPHALARAYERLAPWNFSREFLARIPQHLAVARADDVGWSDWGTPEAIARSFAAMGMVPPLAPARLATAQTREPLTVDLHPIGIGSLATMPVA